MKPRRKLWAAKRPPQDRIPASVARKNRRIRGRSTWTTEDRRLQRVRDARMRRWTGPGSWTDSDRKIRRRMRRQAIQDRRSRTGSIIDAVIQVTGCLLVTVLVTAMVQDAALAVIVAIAGIGIALSIAADARRRLK